MKRLNVFFDGLINTLAVIAGVLIVVMTLIECYEVIARYFLRRPPIWGVEFCEYMLFLVGFLGTTWALREKSHISVTILLERMNPRNRASCDLFASLLGIVISAIMILLAILFLIVAKRYVALKDYSSLSYSVIERKRLSRSARIGVVVFLSAVLVFAFIPYLGIILDSFGKQLDADAAGFSRSGKWTSLPHGLAAGDL